jgi:hypothetical protein
VDHRLGRSNSIVGEMRASESTCQERTSLLIMQIHDESGCLTRQTETDRQSLFSISYISRGDLFRRSRCSSSSGWSYLPSVLIGPRKRVQVIPSLRTHVGYRSSQNPHGILATTAFIGESGNSNRKFQVRSS